MAPPPWVSSLPLAGQRLLVPASLSDLGTRLELSGAEVIRLPLPVTPAARIVMGALPLTGCVASSAAEIDWIDAERGGQGWSDAVVCWCVGRDAAQRARDRGLKNVREIEEGTHDDVLVATIAG